MPEKPLELLKKTAELARLELGEEQAASLAGEIESILAHFAILSTVDVEGVEPTRGATPLADVKRPDDPRPSLEVEDSLANAPDRRGEFFGVPKTLGGAE